MDQRAEWLPPATPTPAPEEVGLPPVEPRRGVKRLAGPLAVLAAAAKLKAVLLLLPKLKLLTTAGSMVVSVAAYSFLWGWQFAIGFVLLLLVHEMGHVIALRREGIPASAPMFIPFLGAVVAAKSLGEDAAAEARVGLAGPVLGSLGAALLIPVWQATGNEFWQALAFTGFFLNLFNLLPVVPLDGGRAMAAMSPWMWFVGLAAMGALAIAFPNPIILVIFVLAAFSTYERWKGLRAGGPQTQAYYRVSRGQRLAIGCVYLGLIAALVAGMDATHLVRTFADV
ncbi:MAG TPA: site-2 protease family protein [Conexibacter sp.]|nr:site-2 protease family protein [Conexibacter sp.]